MTSTYSRSQIYLFDELTETQQEQVKNDFCFEDSDCFSTSYVILERGDIKEALPLSMFMRAGNSNNFTHGIFSTSAFDGYFVTFDRHNEYCTVAHKHF